MDKFQNVGVAIVGSAQFVSITSIIPTTLIRIRVASVLSDTNSCWYD